MKGDRRLFTCPACKKCFFYWVPEGQPQPKVRCYFCSAETFPNGEPPAPPAPAPAPPAPTRAVAAPPAEGTPTPVA